MNAWTSHTLSSDIRWWGWDRSRALILVRDCIQLTGVVWLSRRLAGGAAPNKHTHIHTHTHAHTHANWQQWGSEINIPDWPPTFTTPTAIFVRAFPLIPLRLKKDHSSSDFHAPLSAERKITNQLPPPARKIESLSQHSKPTWSRISSK